MNILLITSYFPPDAHIGSTRWYRIGKALLNRGHQFHVITADNRSRLSMRYAPQVGYLDIQPTTLHRIPYPLPSNLLHWLLRGVRIMSYSAPRRITTRLYGTTDYKHKQAVNNLPAILDYLGKITTTAYRRAFFPSHSWSWGRKAAEYALQLISSIKPQVIIATHPFPGTLRAAALLSGTTKLPWIADIRDPFHNDFQITDNLSRQKLLPLEQALLQMATSIVTINGYLADMLATSRNVEIISNCYNDSEMKIHTLRVSQYDHAHIKIIYTGTIHNNHRCSDLFNSLTTLPPRKETEVVVKFCYYGRFFRHLIPYKQSLCEKGIKLINCGFVSTKECAQAQANSDLLLVFGWKGAGHRCVATGKVFDYLATGKPIIAVTERETALGELIERTGAGVVLDAAEEIKRFFAELRASPQNVLHSLQRKRRPHIIKEYSATEAAKKYETLLLDIINSESHEPLRQCTVL